MSVDTAMPAVQPMQEERRESYTELVWRKFRKSTISIVGGIIIIMLTSMAIFADFLSPTDPVRPNMQHAYSRPQALYLVSSDGQLRLRPFTFNQQQVLDPATFLPRWEPDLSKEYPIRFFV